MSMVFTPDQSGDSALNVALASGWHLVGGTLTLSGSYATGGDSVDLEKMFGSGGRLRRVVSVGAPRGLALEYDKTNKKIKAFIVDVTGNAVTEHTAAAYDSDLTASPMDVAFLVKYG